MRRPAKHSCATPRTYTGPGRNHVDEAHGKRARPKAKGRPQKAAAPNAALTQRKRTTPPGWCAFSMSSPQAPT